MLKAGIRYKDSDMIGNYIKIVDKAMEDAQKEISHLDRYILYVSGMSGDKTRHFLNNLVPKINGRYLEVGVWRGSTFCSALNGSKNNNYSIAIDDWSEFTHTKAKEQFLDNVNRYIDLEKNKIGFIEKDCFKITSNDLRIDKHGKFKVYLYDGPHKFEEHYKALVNYIDFLEDDFIFLCDDWNWKDTVEAGTREAIKDLKLNIHREWVAETPNNTDTDKDGWWNGYFAMVASKPKNKG